MIDRWPEYADRPHYLYRLFDADQTLLYIGCTIDFPKRLAEHRRKQPWADRIIWWLFDHYPDQASALVAEEEAIKAESPEFNAMYNGAGLTGWNAERRASDTCLHGHPWDDNAKVTSQGVRICETCAIHALWRSDAKRGRPYAIRKLAVMEQQREVA